MSRVSPRLAGAVFLLLGVAIGTLADRIPTRSPLWIGEYWILSGDFHVHAFPGDGTLSPWTLRREAERAGLDVIAVTNHNQVFTGRLAGWISRRFDGPIMIAGQEVTNPGYHMIAVGLERTVNADQPSPSTAADIHAQGGIAIAAHPSRRSHGYAADEAVGMLDGTEAAHSGGQKDQRFRAGLRSFYQRAHALKPSIAAIGSSDFHAMPPLLGQCRTYLFVRERSEAGVLDAIRSGRTLAVEGDGNLQGDSTLIDLLHATRPPARSDEHSHWRRLSIVLSWVGTLAIALFRHRSHP
jgi:predicted metal-dependent phosphoesterase TrpH